MQAICVITFTTRSSLPYTHEKSIWREKRPQVRHNIPNSPYWNKHQPSRHLPKPFWLQSGWLNWTLVPTTPGTTLPNLCHFFWRSKSVVKGQVTMEKFHFQYLSVTRSCEHKYFWPDILLLNPELPRTQAVTPPTPSFSFPTPKPIKKFGSKSSYVYNVCSTYRKEVQWLLRFELSGEVLFPETEVVPQHDNQKKN